MSSSDKSKSLLKIHDVNRETKFYDDLVQNHMSGNGAVSFRQVSFDGEDEKKPYHMSCNFPLDETKNSFSVYTKVGKDLSGEYLDVSFYKFHKDPKSVAKFPIQQEFIGPTMLAVQAYLGFNGDYGTEHTDDKGITTVKTVADCNHRITVTGNSWMDQNLNDNNQCTELFNLYNEFEYQMMKWVISYIVVMLEISEAQGKKGFTADDGNTIMLEGFGCDDDEKDPFEKRVKKALKKQVDGNRIFNKKDENSNPTCYYTKKCFYKEKPSTDEKMRKKKKELFQRLQKELKPEEFEFLLSTQNPGPDGRSPTYDYSPLRYYERNRYTKTIDEYGVHTPRHDSVLIGSFSHQYKFRAGKTQCQVNRYLSAIYVLAHTVCRPASFSVGPSFKGVVDIEIPADIEVIVDESEFKAPGLGGQNPKHRAIMPPPSKPAPALLPPPDYEEDLKPPITPTVNGKRKFVPNDELSGDEDEEVQSSQLD